MYGICQVVDVAPTADLGSSWTMVDDDDNTEPDEAMMRKARKNPYPAGMSIQTSQMSIVVSVHNGKQESVRCHV